MTRTPVISTLINNKICSSIFDTGSDVTLMRYSTTKRLGLVIDKRRIPPNIRGINAQPVQILGMTKAPILIGDKFVKHIWFPVIPDAFIERDVLLGMDVIGLVDFGWRAGMRFIQWGDASCDVYYIRRSGHCMKSVTASPKSTQSNVIIMHEQVRIRPHKSHVCLLPIKEQPGTNVMLNPTKKYCAQDQTFLATVNCNKKVPVVVSNYTKNVLKVKAGCIMARYEVCKGEIESEVRVNYTISNELLPPTPNNITGVSRHDRLVNLVDKQKWAHLTPEQQRKLRSTILRNEELFILDKSDLGCMKSAPAHINISDNTPVKTPSYKYPLESKRLISEMLEQMMSRGVIEYSSAAWLSPIVLVSKPDGSKRMCLDFRRVNTHLAADVYPLPRLDELVSSVAGNHFYSTLDMKDAYFQIELDEASRDLTTFSDGAALYRFNRLPFGLSCAPAIFSRKMAEVLAPLAKLGWVRNYLDDIIIMADSYDDLLKRTDAVFKLLNENGIKLNLEKCDLVKSRVKFLGHVVSKQGCSPDPDNIKSILEMERPKNIKDVRRFVGMCSFYRKFVPHFSELTACLTSLTRANAKFEWAEEQQRSFETLKEKLTTTPVLTTYNPSLALVLITDASKTCVGGVLHQRMHDHSLRPLGYFSKKLTPTECRYSIVDKEALGVVLSCRHFSNFLWGRKFEVRTDHQPLIQIFRTKTKCPRVTRWLLEMREYNFTIQYIKGTQNYVADCLSRPTTMHISGGGDSSMWLGLSKENFSKLQREDKVYREICSYLEGDALPSAKTTKYFSDNFELLDGILYYIKTLKTGIIHRLVVPKSLIHVALDLVHDQGGHFGPYKTIGRAENLYYWRCQKSVISAYIKRCSLCAQYKTGGQLHRQVQNIPEVNNPLDRIAIDLIDLYSSNEGYRYVLTVIDHYSRFVKFYPLKNKSATGIEACLSSFIKDFGIPKTLLLDNSMEFRSSVIADWSKQYNINLRFTSPYNPRANGSIERMHQTLKGCLGRLCKGYPQRWPKMLSTCQALLNNSVHVSLSVTPFFAFYGRPNNDYPQGIIPPMIVNPEKEKIKELIVECSKLSKQKYNTIANRKNKKIDQLKVGDLVWVRAEKIVPGTCTKLNARYNGPYRVTKIIGDHVSYEVKDEFYGQVLRRTINKLKPYTSESYIIPDLQNTQIMTELVDKDRVVPRATPEVEHRPARNRQAPRRYIEEI